MPGLKPIPRTLGFTLIELLVVISIIALLIGLLLPILGTARGTSRLAVCGSQVRQLMLAAQVYANDYRGALPPAYDYSAGDGWVYEWDFRRDAPFSPTRVEPGLLWQGRVDVEVFQCPSFDGSANSPGDPFTGYNYNASYLAGYRGFTTADVVPSARIEAIATPSATAVFGDGEWANGANKYMRAPWNVPPTAEPPLDPFLTGSTRAAGTQGFRHAGDTTQVAWADGHASSSRDRRVAGPAAVQASVAAGTGFLDDTNAPYDLE
ncbi:MAG: prepilin-type N-terminal cleavage/methylation domain-containing protein [Planctomycetota bacterium]